MSGDVRADANELLTHTLALVEQGWCREHYAMRDGKPTIPISETPPDQFCILGAMLRARNRLRRFELGDVFPTPDEALARRAIAAAIGLGGSMAVVTTPLERPVTANDGVPALQIIEWQDQPERTHDEVLVALRRALELVPTLPLEVKA